MSHAKLIDKFKLVILNYQMFKKLLTQKNLFKTTYYETAANLFSKIKLKLFDKNFFRYLNKNNSKNKSKFLFTSYCTATFYQKFSWDDYRITNDELENYVTEMLNEFGHKGQNIALNESIPDNSDDQNKWENVFKRSDLMIWRRKLIENELNENVEDSQKQAKNSKVQQPCIYEYKVYGRLFDISPIDFFRTQIDLEYRKTWDHLVVKLEVMSVDKKVKNQTTELIEWIMKFPFPMNSRQYIFVRRYCVDPDKGLLILLSKSIPNSNVIFVNENDEDVDTESIISHNQGHTKDEVQSEEISSTKKKSQYEQPHKQAPYVRVTKFKSNMIIVSHSQDFHSVGLDFYLNYYDDPKAQIPSMAMKWMATSGLPDWLNKLHKAAKGVPKPTERINVTEDYEVVSIKENTENNEIVDSLTKTETDEELEMKITFADSAEVREELPTTAEVREEKLSDDTLPDSNIKEENTLGVITESTPIEEIIPQVIIEAKNDEYINLKIEIKPENIVSSEKSVDTSLDKSLNLTKEVVLISDDAHVQPVSEIPVIQIESPVQEIFEENNDKKKPNKFFRQFDNEPHTSLLF